MESVYILGWGGTEPEHEMLCFNFYFKHVRVANPKFE